MGGDGGAEAAAVADALHDARHVGGAVELAHLAGDADVLVDEGFVVGDHVLGRGGAAVLDGVGRSPEQVPPQRAVQELQQREDPRRSRRRRRRRRARRWVPVQQQWQQPESQRVALRVESVYFSFW